MKLLEEELHYLYSLLYYPNYQTMGSGGGGQGKSHVMHAGFWRGSLEEREHLEDIGVDVGILK